MGRRRPNRARGASQASPAEGDARLREMLEETSRQLAASELARERARRENEELRRENEMLEEQLIRLVEEIGQLKFLTERSDLLEREAKERDQRIAELSADVERLRATLSSGRPTAFAAAAAAARAAQSSLFEPRR